MLFQTKVLSGANNAHIDAMQVQDLVQASKTFGTLRNIIDYDVENDTVRKPGSSTRNLRRVRQGLDLIRALFEQFISSEYVQTNTAYF